MREKNARDTKHPQKNFFFFEHGPEGCVTAVPQCRTEHEAVLLPRFTVEADQLATLVAAPAPQRDPAIGLLDRLHRE